MITDWTQKQGVHGDEQPGAAPPVAAPLPPPLATTLVVRAVLVTLILLVLATGGVLYTLHQWYTPRIYPNVSIQGVAIGQLTSEQVQQRIETAHADFLEQPLTLEYADHRWTPTLAELGAQLDVDEATYTAFTIGRGHPDRMDNVRQIAAVWSHGFDIPLRLTIDQQQLQAYLLARSAEIAQLPTDAQFVIAQGEVAMLPDVAGRQMMMEATIEDITAALQTLQPQTVPVRTRATSALLLDENITQARDEIEQLLHGPITINANGAVWEWSVEELTEMLRVHRVVAPEGDHLEVTLDRAAIHERLQPIANITEYGGQYPRVDWADGALNIIQDGTPVMRVDAVQATERIIAAARSSENRTAEMPFIEAEPPINQHNIHELGIRDLLGVGHSDFSGSASYRITNISVGMERLKGTLLAPGEEFSFNRIVGDIGPENGFVPGYAIVGEDVELEWGGGICQDSTTMFRAAFWAGLPITERKGHSYYINWYDTYGYGDYGHGPGIDATIFTGAQDFKFINDTGHWILVDTYVDVSRALAEVRLYGTDIGREVGFEGPSIAWDGEGGMTVHFTRVIREHGQERREPFVTAFAPWPEDVDH